MALPSTFDISDGKRLWDTIIIGAGPAGSLAARGLAQLGLSVLLVDRERFPRPKVCGCCLNLSALSTLANAGLGNLVRHCGAVPLTDLQFAASTSQASVPFYGMALSRDAFDAALVEAAVQAGVCFLPETRAGLALESDSQHRTTVLRHQGQDRHVKGRIIIGASGLASRLLPENVQHPATVASESRLGAGVIAEHAPSFFRPGVVYMACASGGYVGLVRLEDGRLNVASAFDGAFVKQVGGLGIAGANILRLAGFPHIEDLETLAWHGTPRLTRHAARPSAHRVFLIGDAASFVEPFTGEGMAWALASGLAVVPIVRRACKEWDPTLIGRWTARYRQIIQRRQFVCQAAAAVLRHPKLIQLIVATLNRFPQLAAPVIHHINSTSLVNSSRYS